MSLLAFSFFVKRKQGDTLSSLLFPHLLFASIITHHPLFSQLYPPPTLGCQSWLSPSERQEDEVREEQEHLGEWFSVHLQKEKKWGKKVKFLFHYVIIALRASLSVLISVLQVCAIHVWSWKRAAVDGLKSGVWAGHPVCIFWKTLKSCPNYGKY